MSKRNIKVVEGSGFLARKFSKYASFLKKSNTIVYAAGVSNSIEKKSKSFNRETFRIKKFCKSNRKKLVYISTYSIFDQSRNKNRYTINKIKIEKYIKKNVKNYIILRLPEIVGSNKNPNTLTNFFYQKIKKNKFFTIWKNSKRNLLDVDDAIKICIHFININKNKNTEKNILNKNFCFPLQIVTIFEKILKKKGIYKIVNEKKFNIKIKNHVNYNIIKNLKLKFNKNYLVKTLKKYY